MVSQAVAGFCRLQCQQSAETPDTELDLFTPIESNSRIRTFESAGDGDASGAKTAGATHSRVQLFPHFHFWCHDTFQDELRDSVALFHCAKLK